MELHRLVRAPDLAEAAAFVAAVDEGSLARAGRRLGMSQPAMTKRIRTLEGLVGVTLLERSRRGVRPTEAGRRLYEDATRMLREGERFRASAAALREVGTLRIAVIYTLAEACVARWLGAHRESAQAEAVEVRVGHPSEVRTWVADARSDLGFAAGPVGADPDLVERPFAEDELVAVVPAAHAWARAGRIGLSGLADSPLVVREPGSGTRRTLDDALARAGYSPIAPVLTLASTAAIRSAIRDQGIPGVLSRLSVDAEHDPALVAVPIDGGDLRRPLTVLWRRDARLSSRQRDFLAAARLDGRSAAETLALAGRHPARSPTGGGDRPRPRGAR